MPFVFDRRQLPASPAIAAKVPAGLRTKKELLAVLATALAFPDYFGHNWDALDECLGDPEWWPPGPAVIEHADLPLADDAASLSTYLSILLDRTDPHSSDNRRRLVVYFPIACRQPIALLVPRAV